MDTEINLDPRDIRIDTFNANPSAWTSNDYGVRVTHMPTGIRIECSASRSIHKNKEMAMKGLKEELKKHILNIMPPPTTLDMTLKAHQELEQLLIKRELDLANKFKYQVNCMRQIRDLLRHPLSTTIVQLIKSVADQSILEANKYKPLGEEADEPQVRKI